jgi:hypothetical protein
MRTNIHALNGIQTHGLSVQAIKAYASERVATGTGSTVLQSTILTPLYTTKAASFPENLNMIK